MLENKLQEIGLDDKEARIYLAALELGETTIARIAQKSGIKRTSIYNILDDLQDKGLIIVAKSKGRNLYYAQDPRKLERRINQRSRTMREIMPELLSITNLIDRKPKVKFYEGQESLKEIYEDTLSYPGKEIKLWMPQNTTKAYGNFWNDYYVPQRLEKKIAVRAIIPPSEFMRRFQAGDLKQLRRTRRSKTSFIEAELMLYGPDKLSIISFDEMIGLVIESRALFNTLAGLFETHWESLPEK